MRFYVTLDKLKVSKGISVRPALIYSGDLDQRILKEDYFDRTICFEDLLSKR